MVERKRRRQLLVDPRIQLGLSLRILACMAAYMILFGLVAVLGPLFTIATGMPGDEQVIAAGEKLDGLFSTFLVPGALTFACLAMHCFVMLHRLAGPAYRFRAVMASIRDGDIAGRVKLREGDFLEDVAEAIDTTVASLRSDFEAMKSQALELVSGLENLASPVGADDEAGLAAARVRARRLLDLIGKYRTSSEDVASATAADVREESGLPVGDRLPAELETAV